MAQRHTEPTRRLLVRIGAMSNGARYAARQGVGQRRERSAPPSELWADLVDALPLAPRSHGSYDLPYPELRLFIGAGCATALDELVGDARREPAPTRPCDLLMASGPPQLLQFSQSARTVLLLHRLMTSQPGEQRRHFPVAAPWRAVAFGAAGLPHEAILGIGVRRLLSRDRGKGCHRRTGLAAAAQEARPDAGCCRCPEAEAGLPRLKVKGPEPLRGQPAGTRP